MQVHTHTHDSTPASNIVTRWRACREVLNARHWSVRGGDVTLGLGAHWSVTVDRPRAIKCEFIDLENRVISLLDQDAIRKVPELSPEPAVTLNIQRPEGGGVSNRKCVFRVFFRRITIGDHSAN